MKTIYSNLIRKAIFLVSMLVILGSATSPVTALRNTVVDNSLLLAPAANDDFSHAVNITALPFRRTLSPFEATEAVDDPTATRCNLAPGLATVWYKYRPAAKIMVHMDTIGSSYDTYMAIWRGARGSLTAVACNDDADAATFASAINITLSAGVMYYIEVAQFNGNIADTGVESVKPAVDLASDKTAGAKHVFRLVRIVTRTFKSDGTQDGYVIESKETSGKGLLKDSVLPYLRVGDDEKKRQYRGFLSFNTSALPDNAVVNFALVKLKRSLVSSGSVFTKLGKVKVDIRLPYFGTGLALASADFEAAASRTSVGTLGTAAVSGWFQANLRSTSFAFVNRKGSTQFRLMFPKDDNNDTVADYIRFFSGNSVETNKPILVVRYYIP